jgi:hypothetical protein
MSAAHFEQQAEVSRMVGIAEEARAPIVAALDDVASHARHVLARSARHRCSRIRPGIEPALVRAFDGIGDQRLSWSENVI